MGLGNLQLQLAVVSLQESSQDEGREGVVSAATLDVAVVDIASLLETSLTVLVLQQPPHGLRHQLGVDINELGGVTEGLHDEGCEPGRALAVVRPAPDTSFKALAS